MKSSVIATNIADLQKTIDRCIKRIWLKQIKRDYNYCYLLKEDTLKNAFYYHLRNQLTDRFLEEHRVRIYTEFYYKNGIADLAIVQLKEQFGQYHLKDEIEQVLAIIELKFKFAGNGEAFERDVVKVQKYLKSPPFDYAQYYLAFIHEAVYDEDYDEDTSDSWLSPKQQKWANGRVTELSSWYIGDESVWKILSYNGMNEDIYLDNRELVKKAASEFNEEKYSSEFYYYYLNIVQNAGSITPELKEAVKYLMYWKLGKVSKKRTATSYPIPCTDQIGSKYYLIETTTANRNAIDRSVTNNILESGIHFKSNLLVYEDFKERADSITKTSIVLPTFYTHIWKPMEYPILDVKVWRTYLQMNGFEINKYSKPLSWQHYEEYTNFFHKIKMETGLECRDIDKGLWVLGERSEVKF